MKQLDSLDEDLSTVKFYPVDVSMAIMEKVTGQQLVNMAK